MSSSLSPQMDVTDPSPRLTSIESILQKTTAPTPHPNSSLTAEEKTSRARENAIRQARIIHSQKGVELQILESIEAMLDFPAPLTPKANPATPEPREFEQVQKYLSVFQPSDFDDLIEERKAAGICGYVFCPERPSRGQHSGAFKVVRRIKGNGTGGGRIVERHMFETWCSDNCARRAMYIKVQLLDEPAVLRESTHILSISLMPEFTGKEDIDPIKDPKGFSVANPDTAITSIKEHPLLAQAVQDLSFEKGGSELSNLRGLVVPTIVHKEKVKSPKPPSQAPMDHVAIDGYVPLTRTIWANSVPRPVKD